MRGAQQAEQLPPLPAATPPEGRSRALPRVSGSLRCPSPMARGSRGRAFKHFCSPARAPTRAQIQSAQK